MEKEISSGTMLGIVLIALAAVIGLGFGVFSIAKGVANEGTVGVQDNLNTVTDSAFEDFNDKIVTGTQVKSALQNFEGKSVAILINTTAMNKGVKTYTNHEAVTFHKLGDVPYANYNALLGKDSAGAAAGTVAKNTAAAEAGKAVSDIESFNNAGTAVTMKDGCLTISQAFQIDSNTGKVLFDNSIGGLSRSGNCEYISTSSKFIANLVKDTSGTNIGILFTQMQQ